MNSTNAQFLKIKAVLKRINMIMNEIKILIMKEDNFDGVSATIVLRAIKKEVSVKYKEE